MKYNTEEERKAARNEATKRWYHKHIQERKEYERQYNQTPMRRALTLVSNYNKKDKKYGRGVGDLTAKWVVENIFTKPCAHCGKEGWEIIGCNRIDNSKPHTMDNVEPCCVKCNSKLYANENNNNPPRQVYQYTLDGELVTVWKSAYEAERVLGFKETSINKCCNGGEFSKKRNKWVNIKQHKGYRWSYEPL